MSFPRVLEILDVSSFDYGKALDVFLKVMSDMPSQLRIHLMWTRERVIEFYAWKPGSSIYRLLQKMASSDLHSKSNNGDTLRGPLFQSPNASIPGLSPERRTAGSAFKVVRSVPRRCKTTKVKLSNLF